MIGLIRFVFAVPFLMLGIIALGIYCLIAGEDAAKALVDALQRETSK